MRYFLAIIAVFALLILLNWIYKTLEKRSLDVSDQVELRAIYDRWAEAGKPQGASLQQFLQGRRADLTVNTQHYVVDSIGYDGLLALTNSRSGTNGILIISFNKVLLWQSLNSNVAIVQFPPKKIMGRF